MSDRLFVPLTTEYYRAYLDRRKSFELRGHARNFTPRHVYTGREVELRRGYTPGNSLFGRIGRVVGGTLDEIFDQVDFRQILPDVNSRGSAIDLCRESMVKRNTYIAFEVVLD